MRVVTTTFILAAALAAGACKEKAASKIPLGGPARGTGLAIVDTSPEAMRNNPHVRIPPLAQAALDSANLLFRAKDYKEALVQYRRAAQIAPANAAPYYGIAMTADKLGMKALADSAQKAVAQRTEGGKELFTDSLMKKAHTVDSGKAMPKS